MKYLPLIWATLWRKKTRTIFTLLSVVVAFLLFGMLETVDRAFSHPSSNITGTDKLVTTNKYSITLALPFSDAQQIRSVSGVAEVTWMSWFGGYYQEPKNFVFALPIDTDSYLNLHKGEFIVDDEQLRTFRDTRTGALLNSALMKKFGWKVGDKVPLHSTIWTQKIDALFANSPNETKTQPANDFQMAFIKQFGDIGFVLRAILGAVFFTLLFLTGNTMMQSVRERIPELAVLKTLGFGDGRVLRLVLAESLLLCVIAAIIGLALSYAMLPIIKIALQGVELTPSALIPGIGVAVLLALIVGAAPALRAMRLNIVDALADKR